MKSKKNNNIEISEQIVQEQAVEKIEPEEEELPKAVGGTSADYQQLTKPKKKMTESQLEALAKARIKAQGRKQ